MRASGKEKANAQHILWLAGAITERCVHRILHGLADKCVSGILNGFSREKLALNRITHFFVRGLAAMVPVHEGD
jgi:hypothetical protein